jgi:protein-tyrosine phosphatase
MADHGYNISAQRSRQLTTRDFERFDLILAMDQSNARHARQVAPNPHAADKVQLLLEEGAEVPDPYYGGPSGFEEVYTLIDQAAARWVESWAREE